MPGSASESTVYNAFSAVGNANLAKMADTREKALQYLPAWVVEWLDYYARAAAENPVEFILSGL